MIAFEEVPIFDSLHGFVKITLAEKEIINSLYFQRLREIKQLSFAYYVFPGAVHTRFSHSIGVLATISKILERLISLRTEIPDDEVLVLRMAALVHDIGHYPLSHLIEESYKQHLKKFHLEISSEDEVGGNADILDDFSARFPSVMQEACLHNGHHEQLGAFIVSNTDFEGGVTFILNKHGFDDEQIDNIGLIIQGKSLTTWHNQIIHSELDVDRLDYLLRDSHETGVHYGNFDFEYLINNCRLVEDTNLNKIFAIKSSASFTVEHFLLARYFWYAQIINERTISIFDYLGTTAYTWLINNGFANKYIEVLDLVQRPEDFFKFNDNYFWNLIYSNGNSGDIVAYHGWEFFKQASAYLVNRTPLKRLSLPVRKTLKYKNFGCDHVDDCSSKSKCRKTLGCPKFETERNLEEELNRICTELKDEIKKLGGNPDWVIPLCKKSSISKLSTLRSAEEKERDPIRILQGDKIVFLEDLDHSMVSMLNDYELIQPRVYVKEEYVAHLQKYFNDIQGHDGVESIASFPDDTYSPSKIPPAL